ncbi:MAG: glycerol-3-phosphate 1-O-acyltransferase PlsB [Pseudomonadota bacterium]
MNPLSRSLYAGLSRVMRLWVRPELQPPAHIERVKSLAADPAVRVCYVLENGGLADFLALNAACDKLGLPAPTDELEFGNEGLGRSVVVLRKMSGWLLRRRSRQQSRRLTRLVGLAVDARDASATTVDALPIYLVPVALYWGRSPGKQRSLFSLFFSEDWHVAGRTRRFITTLLHGRHTLMHFSEPLELAPILREGQDAARTFRKTSRVLRVHFRLRREATVGPDLSHRRTLIGEVLAEAPVRALVQAEGAPGSRQRRRAEKKARKYAFEIAADLSYPTVRILERLLLWVWNKIYDGIELNNLETLEAAAEGNELVYVPCHRSHFDYLLLSFVLYRRGFSLPYVAAGINLNLPVVGAILRRGGAFFLRRTFSGNRLYAAVFHAYLKALQTRGYPIEYFIEGGRSRTGRLLAPKGGMISMTVRAFLEDARRPVKFVPIYFGYERLIEGTSFIGELSGRGKKKESLGGLFRSLGALREHFGRVYVNIGEPIDLAETLDAAVPGWRETELTPGERPDWMPQVVDRLGGEILERINAAAAATPISMLALALLGTPRLKMARADLERQLALYQSLYALTPYSAVATVPDMPPGDIIAHGLRMKVISVESHPLGDIVNLAERDAVLLTYFRNNVLHLVALHGLVAACYIHGNALELDELKRLIRLTAPHVRAEMRLHFGPDELDTVVERIIDAMVGSGLLRRDGNVLLRPPAGSAEAFALTQLGQSVVPVLQRYFMTIALMNRFGSGKLTQNRLEELCQLCAERLSIIYGLRSPDFFDRKLFRGFLGTLREQGTIHVNGDGKLQFELSFEAIERDARLVLGEPLRHSILTVTEVTERDDD